MFLAVAAMVPLYGTQRETFTELADPKQWERWRRSAHEHLPDGFDPAPETPPQEYHFQYWLKAKWTSPNWAEYRANAVKAFRGTALHLAQGLGHLPSHHPMYYKRPFAAQWVAFDGTVWQGPSDVPAGSGHRHDSASGWHNKFGDDHIRVWGSKVAFASIRSEDWHGRVVLDYQMVKGPNEDSGIGDEGAAIVAMACRIQDAAPGMRGLIVDGILRGDTLARLAARNLFVINYPTAKTNPDRATKGTINDTRTEKHAKVYVFRHKRRNGTECVHHLWGIGGRLHERLPDVKGHDAFVPLDVTTVQSRRNADGTYRHYLRAVIKCLGRDVAAMVPLYHHPDNGPVLNRGEYLRLYPPGTWQFTALYGRRNDTESLHNEAKLTMPRLPAYGSTRQELFVLGLSLGYNAVTRSLLAKTSPG